LLACPAGLLFHASLLLRELVGADQSHWYVVIH
jgi:hypothetical protein